jgi:signal transduction histidine kinase
MAIKLEPGSFLLVPADSEAFRRQESIFVVLNLVLLASLLLIHTLFISHFGRPSPNLIFLFAGGFLLLVLELIWLSGKPAALTQRGLLALTCASIALNTGLALALALLTDKQDSPYFVLLVVPVLTAAFRLPLPAVIAVAAFADALTFFWVWHFARFHGPVAVTEYFEAGSLSLIFTIVAVLAWSLVKNLRQKEQHLRENLEELERTRERLVTEEKLAAVGRLSSAIAHEIRNPVAMISSSLATAVRDGLEPREREEMFSIAAQEASRLERLTGDFLSYARPRQAQRTTVSVLDILLYVAGACRARAAQRGVEVIVEGEDWAADIDTAQMQQAVLNLVLNAVDASPDSGRVLLRLVPGDDENVVLEVENSGAIAPPNQPHLFEPFFTTKPAGSGLGLAIARKLVEANSGEIALITPGPPIVRFRITLPAVSPCAEKEQSCHEF